MSSAVSARVGRERQLYDENNLRLVSGCIPYKLKPAEDEKDEDDLMNRLLVLMVSTPNRSDLVFPKGGWEVDESKEQAAAREAWEEAGVRGVLSETILGEWIFRSKSKENIPKNEGACKGCMFALEVKEELDSWPEQSTHKRKWVSVREAWRLCRYPWMREALAGCLRFLSRELNLKCSLLSKIWKCSTCVYSQDSFTCQCISDVDRSTLNGSPNPTFLYNDSFTCQCISDDDRSTLNGSPNPTFEYKDIVSSIGNIQSNQRSEIGVKERVVDVSESSRGYFVPESMGTINPVCC